MLGKGRRINQTHTLSDRLGLIMRILPPAPPPKAARGMIVKALRRIVVWPLPAIDLPELRPGRFLPVIGGRCAQGPASLALFIGMVQNIDVRIAFLVFLRRIFRRHPGAIAFGIKARHVNLGLALDHHLRQIITCPPSGRDAKGKALGQPHIRQPRRRPHQRVAIGRVTDRPVIIVLEPDRLGRRNPVDHGHIFLFDPLQIERKEVGPKAFGHRIFKPRRRPLLIRPQDPAPPFLAHIPFGIGIAQNRMLGVRLAPVHQGRVRLGHDILMLDRNGRDLDPKHLSRPLCMIARGRHHMFGMDHHLLARGDQVAPLLDHLRAGHIPMVARPVIAVHLPFAFNRNAQLPRTLGHGLRDIGWIDVAIGGVINRPLKIFGPHQRPTLFDLVGCQPLIGDADRFGGRGIKHVFIHARLRLGHAQIAHNVKARIEACFGL